MRDSKDRHAAPACLSETNFQLGRRKRSGDSSRRKRSGCERARAWCTWHHATVETIGRNARRLNVGRATSHPFEKPGAAQLAPRPASGHCYGLPAPRTKTVQPKRALHVYCACYSILEIKATRIGCGPQAGWRERGGW